MSEQVLSVGIDIGTTTSQIIFSRLTIQNKSGLSRIPQINITDKEIIYKSDVYMTPLINFIQVDKGKLSEIVKSEYKKAGILPSEISFGAVIITGESARKENSEDIVHSLGDIAGDFVAASAGPDLEGIIAGRGCGAAKLSKEKKQIVANVDIGGGTSNVTIFDDGIPIDTTCLDIGGRQIRFKEGSKEIEYIAPKTLKLIDKLGINLKVGSKGSLEEIEKLCSVYSEIILSACNVVPKDNIEFIEIMTTDHLLKSKIKVNNITFSGGVGDVFYNGYKESDLYKYNDIGIIFGKVLKKVVPESVSLLIPEETIRATVIGAGAFTVELSGSTISYEKEFLPLKNIPVIKLSNNELSQSPESIISVIQKKIKWSINSFSKGVALSLKLDDVDSYDKLCLWRDIILEAAKGIIGRDSILIILMERDLAKALGQTLRVKNSINTICLDEVMVNDGDFIDIGKPLSMSEVLPVVVKSLIFTGR